jgi:exodeoxyribonuclease VII large subunit
VVTSTHGAALRDVIAVVRRRCPVVELVLVPAIVQGDDAPQSIVAALRKVSRCPDVDVVIVGRGGGAREDLWAFNDERVARALAACPAPTVAAIGHEVDVTLCDLVADARAPTPSAAAELAVPVLNELRARVLTMGRELQHAASDVVRRAARAVDDTATALSRNSERILTLRRAQLEGTAARLNALSPLGTLARGFALATDGKGHPIASIAQVTPGELFSLRLRDGEVEARAESTRPFDATDTKGTP